MLHSDWTVSSLPLREVASADTTDIVIFFVPVPPVPVPLEWCSAKSAVFYEDLLCTVDVGILKLK